jgi:hypothetical protein
MVYVLARRWQVEILDSAFGAVTELRTRLDQIEDLTGDLQNSEEEQRGGLQNRLYGLREAFSGKATALGWIVCTPQPASKDEATGARTVINRRGDEPPDLRSQSTALGAYLFGQKGRRNVPEFAGFKPSGRDCHDGLAEYQAGALPRVGWPKGTACLRIASVPPRPYRSN